MEQKDRNNSNAGAEPAEERTAGVPEETAGDAPAEEKEDNALPEQKEDSELPAGGAAPSSAETREDNPVGAPAGAAAPKKGDAPVGRQPGKAAGQKTGAQKKTGTAAPGKKGAPRGGSGQKATAGAKKTGARQGNRGAGPRQPARTSSGESRTETVNRSAEERKKKKKRRDAFLVILILLMVGAGLVILSTTVFFNASKVTVSNPLGRYTDERIAEASGLKSGDNMLTTDMKGAEDAVERALPYIRVATVGRKWPDTFVIEVEYAEMILAVRKGNAYVYIDIDGKVLETDVAVPEDFAALVNGVHAESAVPGEKIVLIEGEDPDILIGIARGLYENGIGKVTAIDVSNPTDVVVELDHRIEVKFGGVSTFADKIAFGKTVIEKNMKEGSEKLLVIDLTTQSKAFVREKQDPSRLPATGTDAEKTTPTDAEEEDDWDYDEDYDEDDEDDDWDYDEEDDEDYDEDDEYYDEYDDEDWDYED